MFLRQMTTDNAARGGTNESVVRGVAGYAADDCTLDAAFCVSRRCCRDCRERKCRACKKHLHWTFTPLLAFSNRCGARVPGRTPCRYYRLRQAQIGFAVTALKRFVVLCCVLIAAPATAGDPHAPQLDISFLAQPAPLIQNGSTRLFYEMLITSFAKSAYVVNSITAKAGDPQSTLSGTAVAPLMLHIGAAAVKDDPAERRSATPTTIKLGPIGPQHPFTHDYPAVNALVIFK
jgi:hypothetical protein